ncbi:uncharacterized oxidoreductase YccK [Arthrobacter sp. Hiyo8]|nr:uncharacterized oxidoreductase YccK [Arthrobacter sp. Hiyo8]
MDCLDLVQLHCPPTPVCSRPEVYDALETLVSEGAIKDYGVSVERTDEALEAIKHGTATVQIILNAFRLKPLEGVLPAAKNAGVGIIARVPLASGLLSGKYSKDTVFAENDHRKYNRNGAAFDAGETFSGVDFEQGLKAVDEFKKLVPSGATTAQAAIAWIAAQDGVSTVIPGARSPEQAAPTPPPSRYWTTWVRTSRTASGKSTTRTSARWSIHAGKPGKPSYSACTGSQGRR